MNDKVSIERAQRSELENERSERTYWMQSSDTEWLLSNGQEIIANILFHPDWGFLCNVAVSENEDNCISHCVTVGTAKALIEDYLNIDTE